MRILIAALPLLLCQVALPCSCKNDPLTKQLKGAIVVVGKSENFENGRARFVLTWEIKGKPPSPMFLSNQTPKGELCGLAIPIDTRSLWILPKQDPGQDTYPVTLCTPHAFGNDIAAMEKNIREIMARPRYRLKKADFEAKLKRARHLLETQRPGQARNVLDDFESLDEDDDERMLLLSRAYTNLGKFEEADAVLSDIGGSPFSDQRRELEEIRIATARGNFEAALKKTRWLIADLKDEGAAGEIKRKLQDALRGDRDFEALRRAPGWADAFAGKAPPEPRH